MKNSVKSFGCSFIFGTDLADDGRDSMCATASALSYPALIAKHLGYQYQCFAKGGSGNLLVHERILSQIDSSTSNDLFVVNWTYIDRFDYFTDQWRSLMPIDTDLRAVTYFGCLQHDYKDKLVTLQCIDHAVMKLQQHRIPFVMTYMDHLIFDTIWYGNSALEHLQRAVKPWLDTFDGLNFLQWSKRQGFAISDTEHPLEQAHVAAADMLLPKIYTILNAGLRL